MKKDSFPILLLIIAIMAIMLLFQKNETNKVILINFILSTVPTIVIIITYLSN